MLVSGLVKPRAKSATMQRHAVGDIIQAEQHGPGRTCLSRRLASHPGHGNTLHVKKRHRNQRGERDQAVQFMNEALAAEPTNPAFHHNLGLVYVDLEIFDEAEQLLS